MSTNPIQLIPTEWYTYPRRKRLWFMAGKKCHWCHRPTRLSDDQAWDSTTIDHVLPRYKGGSNEDGNLVAACQRCNNRRSHEDARNLPEGHLLGKWKEDAPNPPMNPQVAKHVALTGDEKRALMAKRSVGGVSQSQVHIEQRDQALKEVAKLRDELSKVQIEANLQLILVHDKNTEIADLKARMESMTVRYLIRKRIADWLLR